MEDWTLKTEIEIALPFHCFDAMGVMWHGNYVVFMEEGREAFLQQHGLSYLYMLEQGYTEPVTDMSISYRDSFRYGDTMLLEVVYRPSLTAKLLFDYRFLRKSDMKTVCTAHTVQHFLHDGELELSRPIFYRQWQERMKNGF